MVTGPAWNCASAAKLRVFGSPWALFVSSSQSCKIPRNDTNATESTGCKDLWVKNSSTVAGAQGCESSGAFFRTQTELAPATLSANASLIGPAVLFVGISGHLLHKVSHVRITRHSFEVLHTTACAHHTSFYTTALLQCGECGAQGLLPNVVFPVPSA